MVSDIQLLELAIGIRDSLVRVGFLTIESILVLYDGPSVKVGVDLYIAQIILQEARGLQWGLINSSPSCYSPTEN